jgi:hypothetical protein
MKSKEVFNRTDGEKIYRVRGKLQICFLAQKLDIYSAQMVAITSVIISMGGIHVVI